MWEGLRSWQQEASHSHSQQRTADCWMVSPNSLPYHHFWTAPAVLSSMESGGNLCAATHHSFCYLQALQQLKLYCRPSVFPAATVTAEVFQRMGSLLENICFLGRRQWHRDWLWAEPPLLLRAEQSLPAWAAHLQTGTGSGMPSSHTAPWHWLSWAATSTLRRQKEAKASLSKETQKS